MLSEEALDDVKSLEKDYVSNIGNLQDDHSRNLSRVGNEAMGNKEKIKEENQQVESYEKAVKENPNKTYLEETEKINKLRQNFETAANDFFDFANKKGQRTINDAQKWFKEK